MTRMETGHVDAALAEHCMRRAIELGRRAAETGEGGPFGAVIVRDGAIVGEGWNQVIASNDPTAHGEIMAIRDACDRAGSFDLQGCHIYTSGEPCPMCLGAIYWARIGHVFYGFSIHAAEICGFDDQRFYQQLALPQEQRDVGQTQVLGEEAFAVLQQYLGRPDRVPY
ncbi:nucleoside deaminase [Haliea sp. E1-2-M8]|uniref:nucleoside deaminase n=1 Tax=Haliea sp. E1-2-M8 TaxID=3064706 RepID=UPI002722E12F|nr:nucleoside deaminase [Haliea sp. E1-2-M8]MDO8860576.1 nucleoside deaminase [Haliea sp. E1-2-M8]